MGSHPVNLAIRFILELTTLLAAGFWAWNLEMGWPRYILMILLPLLLAATWGIFAVPGDPSRSGKTVIPVPGIIRLMLELGFFAFGAWAINDAGHATAALIIAAIAALHYLTSYDRVRWLLKQR